MSTKRFFPSLAYFFWIVLNVRAAFFKTPGHWASFSRWTFREYFSERRELKNVQLWIKCCAHHCQFQVSQPIRVEAGRDYWLYYGWTTMEKLILLVSEYLFSLLDRIEITPYYSRSIQVELGKVEGFWSATTPNTSHYFYSTFVLLFGKLWCVFFVLMFM